MQNQSLEPVYQTDRTDDRRHYPKNNLGIKDEWAALSQHQQEMNEQIMRYQKELKMLQSRQLGLIFCFKKR